MSDFLLRFPPDFDDYGWEVESKGWFGGADVVWDGAVIQLTFYDPVRLAEEIGEEIGASRTPAYRNLILVPVVTRGAMEQAVRALVETGEIDRLSPS
jgi:hypothetical protein